MSFVDISNVKNLDEFIYSMGTNLGYRIGISDLYGIFGRLTNNIIFHETVEAEIINHFEEKKKTKREREMFLN